MHFADMILWIDAADHAKGRMWLTFGGIGTGKSEFMRAFAIVLHELDYQPLYRHDCVLGKFLSRGSLLDL